MLSVVLFSYFLLRFKSLRLPVASQKKLLVDYGVECEYLKGSPLSQPDLLRAAIPDATKCVILSNIDDGDAQVQPDPRVAEDIPSLESLC